jgi:imidazolonepropionase
VPATGDPPVLVRGIAALWTGRALLRDAAVVLASGRVAWVGREADAPGDLPALDGGGCIGLPGLVDCHTHACFAGSRVDDFARRLAGATYAEILEAGGGIHHTVRETARADLGTLAGLTRARLAGMLAGGVTTVEIKSGYGLALEPERRMLQAAALAGGPARVVPTLLAHTIPVGRDRARFVDEVVDDWVPACAPFARAIDVYCDRGAFSLAEAARILAAGRAAGLAVRAHAEQVTHTGIAALAASLGASSCDHLERIDGDGVATMARAGTVAVLLPGAMLYLRDAPPPVGALRAAGVPLAVATDFNPGSSPVRDLLASATLACLGMGLSPEEALAAITVNAARAIGRPDLGRVEVGATGDLALYLPPPGEPADPRVLVQYLGGHRAFAVFVAGERVV